MRRPTLLLLIALVLFAYRPAAAQPGGGGLAAGAHLRFEQLTIDDGLSQNAGLALLQDSRGYLWIGTQDGLNRYDGYTIKQFKHDPDHPNSLSHNSILALSEDRGGALWIGTWGGGLNRYDPATGQFTRFEPDPENPAGLSHDIVTDIYDDGHGALWVATFGGLDRLTPETGEFTHHRHSPEDPATLSSDIVSVIAPASDGKLWIGTGAFNTPGAGLNLFDPASGKSWRFSADGACLASPNISDILPLSDGSLWIAYGGYGVAGGGLDHYNPATGACRHFDDRALPDQITDNNLTDLIIDRDGALWASTWAGGVWRLPPGGDAPDGSEMAVIHHDPADPESLSHNGSFSIIQDRSGVIWIGTLTAGINKLDVNSLQFRTYRTSASTPHGLPGDHVGSFAQTRDGSLWLGIWEHGISRFDPAAGTFTEFRHDPENPNSLSSDMVTALFADRDGSLWIGTLGSGLNRFDPRTGRFTRYAADPDDPSSLPANEITTLTRDGAGRLWVGTLAGLSLARDETENGELDFVTFAMPAPPVVLRMIGDELWIGTWGAGVFRLDLTRPENLDPEHAVFSSLTKGPDGEASGEQGSISNNGVWAILQSTDGYVWLATEGGLNRYDPRTGAFKVYTEKDGLRNATILGLLEDGRGYLWMTTNNGLAKFDPQTETFQIYDKNDGLAGNEFTSNAAYQDAAGQFYVGGVSGFSVFDPLALRDNNTPPPVVITGFSIFNTPQPVNLSAGAPIRLNYDQDFISFEFAALDYHDPRQNRYAYKLEGFDEDWVQAGTRNYASYTNLPGGDYTFHVKAANSDGVWNETGTAVPLHVTPPFWQTWPFQVGLMLGIISLVAAGFQLRVQAVRAQNTRLQQMVNEQQRVEVELRQSEARFRAMFENSAVGIGLMSLDRKVLDSNPAMCAMLGCTREELVGNTPAVVTHPDDYAESTEQFKRLLAGEINHYISERRYLRKNGEPFWAQVSMSLVCDAGGKPAYLVGLINDIDAQKRAAERLAEQEAEYRRLLEQRIAERTEELNRANERLRDKAAQEAVTAERTRLARDLHDAVTQTLFSTTLIAEVLPDIWAINPDEGRRRLDEVRRLTRGALAEMRTLLVELRPNALVEVPLPTLLRQLAESLTGRAQISIEVSADGERRLPAEVQVGLYRIAQEALNNVVKHSRASRAVVTLRCGEEVRLAVADDGRGFDPSAVTADHLGLKIMRERTESIGAKLSLYSEPGEGTQISVVWRG